MKLLKRLYDVLCDLVAVKTFAATIITVVFLTDTATFGIVGFTFVAVAWLCVVGFRYAEKVMYLVKGKGE